jgi:hypothetical protein
MLAVQNNGDLSLQKGSHQLIPNGKINVDEPDEEEQEDCDEEEDNVTTNSLKTVKPIKFYLHCIIS